ncbi:MAG: hypothetical protein U0790_13025 [Isosphaeraceae bacterium]
MARQNRAGESRKSKKRPSRSKASPRPPVQQEADVLERGDIFFFYRPGTQSPTPGSLLEVNRFHVVLRPEDGERLRYLTIGKKKLPGDGQDGRHWGFVAGVFEQPEDLRNVLLVAGESNDTGNGSRTAAVPAGEGIYALVRKARNTVLAYALELPEQPGEVQREFNIVPRGHFTLTIKNPEVPSPEGIGLDDDRKAAFPEELQERFGSRKWIGADPPAFLDYEGTEFLLIAGDERVEEAEIELTPEPEDESSAEIFHGLDLEPSERAIKPLFEGTWA